MAEQNPAYLVLTPAPVLIHVRDTDLAVVPTLAPVPTRAVEPIVVEAIILVPVLVRVTHQTLAIVMVAVLHLILAKFIITLSSQ